MERSENLKRPIGRAIDLDLFINFFNKSSPKTFKIRTKNKTQCEKYTYF